jgi:hypothetical protein
MAESLHFGAAWAASANPLARPSRSRLVDLNFNLMPLLTNTPKRESFNLVKSATLLNADCKGPVSEALHSGEFLTNVVFFLGTSHPVLRGFRHQYCPVQQASQRHPIFKAPLFISRHCANQRANDAFPVRYFITILTLPAQTPDLPPPCHALRARPQRI